MMRSAFLVLLTVLVLADTAGAADRRRDSVVFPNGRSDWRASSEVAGKRFWAYATCVNDTDPKGVAKLVAFLKTGEDIAKVAHKFASSHSRCLGHDFDELRSDAGVYLSGISGVALAREYEGQPAPDYTAIAPVFTMDVIGKAISDLSRQRLVLLAFAECVIRTAPEPVLGMMRAPYLSVEELVFWKKLNEPMGYCLPAEEGASLELDKFVLRISFAHALTALEVQKAKLANSVKDANSVKEGTE